MVPWAINLLHTSGESAVNFSSGKFDFGYKIFHYKWNIAANGKDQFVKCSKGDGPAKGI